MATARPVARPLEGRAVVARASCSYMTVLPRPCRRSALVGRALPGLDAGCRDAFASCVVDTDDCLLEGGSEEPNAECCLLGRVDVAERMRSFLSARGICAVRFPSAVCLLMPDGSNDLGACDGCIDGSESRIRKMRFEDKAVDFLGKKWRAGCGRAGHRYGSRIVSPAVWCSARVPRWSLAWCALDTRRTFPAHRRTRT